MDIQEQYDKIYRYCYFKLYDTHLAQDITQEAFLRFYRQGFSLEHEKAQPYLYTIAKNLCIDEFRKRPATSMEEAENEAAPDPSDEWIDTWVLRAAVSRLPGDEQELLFLRYINELPMAAVCKITGLSRFAVYRRLSKSLKWLKEELKKEGISE